MKIRKFKLFESPDSPTESFEDEKGNYINLGYMSYSKPDAFPFGYVNLQQHMYIMSINNKYKQINDITNRLQSCVEISDHDRTWYEKNIESCKDDIERYEKRISDYCRQFKVEDLNGFDGFDVYPSVEDNELDEIYKKNDNIVKYTMLCGDQSTTHGELGTIRYAQIYNGRIWLNRNGFKYISFWKYPETYEKLISVLKDIEKSYKIKTNIDLNFLDSNGVPNNDWVIEVEGGEDRHGHKREIVIPIKKYKGGEQRSAEELAKLHFDPKARAAEVKRKLDAGEDIVKKGWGSRTYDEKLPKDMPPAQYIDKITKNKFTEGMDIKRFKIFESPDNITLFSKEKNEPVSSDYDRVGAKPFAWVPKKEIGVKLPRMKDGKILVNVNDAILYQADFNKIWVGEFREGHSDSCPFLQYGSDDKCNYGDLIHKGRLWFENIYNEPIKAISFWDIRYYDADEMRLCLDSLQKETGIDFENDGWSIDDPFINNLSYDETNKDGTNILTPIKEWFLKKQPKVITKDVEPIKTITSKPRVKPEDDVPAIKNFNRTYRGMPYSGDSLVIKNFGEFLK